MQYVSYFWLFLLQFGINKAQIQRCSQQQFNLILQGRCSSKYELNLLSLKAIIADLSKS